MVTPLGGTVFRADVYVFPLYTQVIPKAGILTSNKYDKHPYPCMLVWEVPPPSQPHPRGRYAK